MSKANPQAPIRVGERTHIEALMVRIGFWGPLYYIYDTQPPEAHSSYQGPHITRNAGLTVAMQRQSRNSARRVG